MPEEHYMIKEIREGPNAIKNTIEEVEKNLPSLVELIEKKELTKGYIIGSGTSFHASLMLQILLNKYTDLKLIAIPASEFCSWAPQDLKGNLIIALSQSGESTDVIISVKYAKEKGAKIVGITNTPGSTLTKLADVILLTKAGEEKAVAATKTYDAQLAAVSCVAYRVGKKDNLLNELRKVPNKVKEVIDKEEEISKFAEILKKADNVFVLGTGINYPNALEASLKLKETCMIHAEGFAVREFLHGPIQLVDETTPIIVLIPNKRALEESTKTLEKLKNYNAVIIGVCGPEVNLDTYTDKVIKVPEAIEETSMFTIIKAIQILAYYTSVGKGLNPDKPTKLTKVVKYP